MPTAQLALSRSMQRLTGVPLYRRWTFSDARRVERRPSTHFSSFGVSGLRLRLFVQGMDVTYIGQDMRWPALSDARVPCVPIFCPQHAGAQAFAELFEVISDREAGDVFDVLVAELAGNAHAQRSAEWHRQLAAVHTVADESLRVQRLCHVDAIPCFGLDRAVHNVSGLGQRP